MAPVIVSSARGQSRAPKPRPPKLLEPHKIERFGFLCPCAQSQYRSHLVNLWSRYHSSAPDSLMRQAIKKKIFVLTRKLGTKVLSEEIENHKGTSWRLCQADATGVITCDTARISTGEVFLVAAQAEYLARHRRKGALCRCRRCLKLDKRPVLQLPAELRNKIYRLALLENKNIVVNSSWRQPNLLRVNRQVRGEASSTYYIENVFTVILTDFDCTPYRKFITKTGIKQFYDKLPVPPEYNMAAPAMNWANFSSWLFHYYRDSSTNPAILPRDAPDGSNEEAVPTDDYESPEDAKKHDVEKEPELDDLSDDQEILLTQQNTADADDRGAQSDEAEEDQVGGDDSDEADSANDPDGETTSKEADAGPTQPASRRRKQSKKSAADQAEITRITNLCKVYGRNGLPVGDWFKDRTEIREKHGHSETQAGVCAGEKGAYAAVVADVPYRTWNRDWGDEIHFAATGANKMKGPAPIGQKLRNHWVSPLRKSRQSKYPNAEPVRVFRGARRTKKIEHRYQKWLVDKNVGGFRYDGLYNVTKRCWASREGKFFEMFYLNRVEGQPEDWTMSEQQ